MLGITSERWRLLPLQHPEVKDGTSKERFRAVGLRDLWDLSRGFGKRRLGVKDLQFCRDRERILEVEESATLKQEFAISFVFHSREEKSERIGLDRSGTMSSPAGVPGTVGLFSGFTRLSKGLAAVLVTGFLANAFFPHAISDTFSLIPGRFIPYVWNIITPGFLETSIFGLAVSIASILVVGRHLEPFWGSREFFKFIVFVNVFACTNTFVLAIFLYFITRQGDYLYAPISGFHGVLAGFLVAVKQINPEQEIPSLFKLRAKWSPSLFVTFAILSSLFSTEPIQYVPFIVFGTYGAWIYLRYFQRKPEAGLKGDSSAEFAFATFFPAPVQPFVSPVSAICEKIFCRQRSLISDEAPGVELGKPLPGSDAVEASRRRERGARALEERLGSTAKAVAEGLPVKGSSKGDLEAIGSDDLV